MTNHIRLPAERIEQLRLIAEAKNQTVVEVIADFVRGEIEKGTIPATVPGIDVATDGASISVKSRDGFEATIPMGEGPTVADLLRQGGSLPQSDPERKKRWLEGAAALTGVRLKRAGNGMKIVSLITGREYPINLDIAADLGDQIDRAAE